MESEWKKAKLLIWGKTYPEFSKKYFETVCTGAVDAESRRLVRIYPVTLRYQKEPFSQYQWIEADIQRNLADRRPESHRIHQESIKVLDKLDTKDGWRARSEFVLHSKNVFPSVEALWEAQARDDTSLGLVKIKRVNKVFVRKLPPEEKTEWDEQRDEAQKQKELYVDVDTKTKDLVFMPIRYVVQFECQGSGCKGHEMSVLDWGTYVLSRRQYAARGPQGAERDVIAKIKENTNPEKKDAYLFLGNTLAHPASFMIVGFYFPPLEKAPDEKEETDQLGFDGF